MLGIVETDYFGLTYHSSRKGNELWLNLRNRVCQEVPGSQPYRLEFRVKFFVPAHTIQQDATRYIMSLSFNQLMQLYKLAQAGIDQTLTEHMKDQTFRTKDKMDVSRL